MIFFFFLFFLVLLYQKSHPGRTIEAKKEGRDSKSRQARTRSTMLEEHTKLSCKGGH